LLKRNKKEKKMHEKGPERFISQNVSLPISLRNTISKEAQRRGLSISELVRIAVIKEIRAEKLAREERDASK
jgi:hypothetical protein